MRRYSVWILCLSALLLFVCQNDQLRADRIRQPAVAGQFYPGQADQLRDQIREFLDISETVDVEGRIVGIWVPHAGYIFSGQVAANAYAAIRGRQYDLIVLIGASHQMRLQGGSVGNWSPTETKII